MGFLTFSLRSVFLRRTLPVFAAIGWSLLQGNTLPAQTREPLESWDPVFPSTFNQPGQTPVAFNGRLLLLGELSASAAPALDAAFPLLRFPAPGTTGRFCNVAAGNGRLVALSIVPGSRPGLYAPEILATPVLSVSTDGVRWREVYRGAPATSYLSWESTGAIVFTGSEFVANVALASPGRELRSSDGETWSDALAHGTLFQRPPVFCRSAWYHVPAAVAPAAVSKVFRSTDLRTWTAVGDAPFNASSAASNSTALVLISGTSQVATSLDGTTWTTVNLSGITASRLSVANDRFHVAGTGGMAVSGDGTAWTYHPAANGAFPTQVVAFGSTLVGNDESGALFRGQPGAWTRTLAASEERDLRVEKVFASDGVFVMDLVDSANRHQLRGGLTGETPRTIASSLNSQLVGLARTGTGVWVLALANGSVLRSDNGRDWRAPATTPVITSCTKVVAAGGTVQLNGGVNYVTTTNGDTATVGTSPFLIYGGDATHVFTSNGSALYFSDGTGITTPVTGLPSISGSFDFAFFGTTSLFAQVSRYPSVGSQSFLNVYRTNTPTSWTAAPVRFEEPTEPDGLLAAVGDRGVVVSGDQLHWSRDGGNWTAGARLWRFPVIRSDGDVLYAYSARQVMRSASVTPRPGLVGLSTRGFVGTGDDVMIAGFTITGDAPRRVLLRAAGPALAAQGVSGVLADPEIELLKFSGATPVSIATNDNWSDASNAAAVANAVDVLRDFPYSPGSRDAALLLQLDPGVYTLHVRGRSAGTGVALAEIYDVDTAPTDTSSRRIVALSTRLSIRSGDAIAIAGLVIQGDRSKQMLLRGIGPLLTAFGVSGALRKPRLEVYRFRNGTSELVGIARRWSDESNAPALALAMTDAGLSVPAVGSDDSALLLELEPGAYTIQLKADDGVTGTGLIEAYEIR